MNAPKSEQPPHLQARPQLFERHGNRVTEAPEADVAVALRYPAYDDKGPLVAGLRLTLMSRQRRYKAGEEVRVVHVVEAPEPGRQLYVAGPKPAYGEYVDGSLATAPPPADVWEPATYNGPVAASPAVDYNYEITRYHFERTGVHRIQWRVAGRGSNELVIEVVP